MKKIVMAAVCLAALAGCATQAKYEAKLDTYKGLSGDELVAKVGTPAKNYATKMSTFTTYYKDEKKPELCETTFQLKDDKVVGWTIKGDECVSH